MISPNTSLKAPPKFLSYQITILIILFVVTLPLNLLSFIPTIILVITYVIFRLRYKNFSFVYNDQNIEIKKGIVTKSQKTISYNTIQNININSGWLMRMFKIQKLEIWTSSPGQIQIFRNQQQGYQTEHKPDGIIFLETEDAETLKNFIMSHK